MQDERLCRPAAEHRIHRRTAPFVWVGANAIYLMSNVVDFCAMALRFVGGDVGMVPERQRPGLGGLVAALFSVFLCVAVARFLYRRAISIRL
jgi:hypothetical protein